MGNSFAVKNCAYVEIWVGCVTLNMFTLVCIYYTRYIMCLYSTTMRFVLYGSNKNNTPHSWAAEMWSIGCCCCWWRPFWPVAITGQASDARQSCDCAAGPAGRNENKSILVVLWTPSVCNIYHNRTLCFLQIGCMFCVIIEYYFCKRDCIILSENSGMFVHLCTYKIPC